MTIKERDNGDSRNKTLKVLLASAEGEDFFHLLDDVEGIEISRCPGSEVTQHAADIDILFGHPTIDLLKAAPRLKRIQSSSAGVEFVARIPELVASDIMLTTTPGAHGPSIGEHTMALLLAMTWNSRTGSTGSDSRTSGPFAKSVG